MPFISNVSTIFSRIPLLPCIVANPYVRKTFGYVVSPFNAVIQEHWTAPTSTNPRPSMHDPTPAPDGPYPFVSFSPKPPVFYATSQVPGPNPAFSFSHCFALSIIFLILFLGHMIRSQSKRVVLLEAARPEYKVHFDTIASWSSQICRRINTLKDLYDKQTSNFMENFHAIQSFSERTNEALVVIEDDADETKERVRVLEKSLKENAMKLEAARKRIVELETQESLRREESQRKKLMEKEEREKSDHRTQELFAEMRAELQKFKSENEEARSSEHKEIEAARVKDQKASKAARRRDIEEMNAARVNDQKESERSRKNDIQEMKAQMKALQDAACAEGVKCRAAEKRAEENERERVSLERRVAAMVEEFEKSKRNAQTQVERLVVEMSKQVEDTARVVQVSSQMLIDEVRAHGMQQLEESEKATTELIGAQIGLVRKDVETARRKTDSDIQFLKTATRAGDTKNAEHSALVTSMKARAEEREAVLRAEIVGMHQKSTKADEKMKADVRLTLEKNTTDHLRREKELVKALEQLDREIRDSITKRKQEIQQLSSQAARNHQLALDAVSKGCEAWVADRKKDEEDWRTERRKDRADMRIMRSDVSKGLTAAVQHKTRVCLRLLQQTDVNRDLRVLIQSLSKEVRECRKVMEALERGRQGSVVRTTRSIGLPTPAPTQSPPSLKARRFQLPTPASSESPPSLRPKTTRTRDRSLSEHVEDICMPILSIKLEDDGDNSYILKRSKEYDTEEQSSSIVRSPSVSTGSLPSLPISKTPLISSASQALSLSSRDSDWSMGRYLPNISAEDIEYPDLRLASPEIEDLSLGGLGRFGRSASRPINEDSPSHMQILSVEHSPPSPNQHLATSVALLSSASGVSVVTDNVVPTIYDIGSNSWEIAHDEFCPLGSSGLGPRPQSAKTESEINLSLSTDAEERRVLVPQQCLSIGRSETSANGSLNSSSSSEQNILAERSGSTSQEHCLVLGRKDVTVESQSTLQAFPSGPSKLVECSADFALEDEPASSFPESMLPEVFPSGSSKLVECSVDFALEDESASSCAESMLPEVLPSGPSKLIEPSVLSSEDTSTSKFVRSMLLQAFPSGPSKLVERSLDLSPEDASGSSFIESMPHHAFPSGPSKLMEHSVVLKSFPEDVHPSSLLAEDLPFDPEFSTACSRFPEGTEDGTSLIISAGDESLLPAST